MQWYAAQIPPKRLRPVEEDGTAVSFEHLKIGIVQKQFNGGDIGEQSYQEAQQLEPIPSFHYQDLKRIKILQQNLVGSRNAQAQREIMEEANLKYEKAYSLSIKLQSEKVKMEEKLRTIQLLEYKRMGRLPLAIWKPVRL